MEQTGLPISIIIGSANEHDSTKFVDVMESISDYLDEQMIEEIVSVCRQGLWCKIHKKLSSM